MRALRWVQLGVLVLGVMGAGRAHAVVHLELEAGGGMSLRGPHAPMVTGRAGFNFFNLLDVGLRGEAALGGSPDMSPCLPGATHCATGYKAWAAFPELRLRTPTPVVQLDLALGAGIGHLTGIALSEGIDGNDGAKTFAQAGVGLKLTIPGTDVYLRAEGSVSLFTGVVGPDIGNGYDPGLLPVYQVQLMIGYAGIGF